VPAYKLASPQVQGNLPLVKQVAETGKPIFFSIGYCDYGDIAAAMNTFKEAGNEVVIPLHCTSKYPTLPEDANLRFMGTLQAMTGRLVGFSDHTLGTHLTVAAVALGSHVIEKHVTQNRSAEGPDHHFALTFPEFSEMVSLIKETSAALGDGTRMTLGEEAGLREMVLRKAVAAEDIAAGEQIDESKLIFMRAADDGIAWEHRHLLSLCRAKRQIPAESLIQWGMLDLYDENYSK